MISCPGCQAAVPANSTYQAVVTRCSACKLSMEITAFPSLDNEQISQHAESLLTGDDSACFHHSGKKAVVACDFCGCFLCNLCDVKIGKQHLCPNCLAKGKDKSKASEIIRGYTMYDSIAYWLSLAPFLIFFLVTIITAPITLGYIWIHRKRPLGLVRKSRWRFWVAGIMAVLQIIAWAVAGVFFFNIWGSFSIG